MKFIAWLKKKKHFVPIIIFILAALPFIFNSRDFFLSDDWDFLTQAASGQQPWWRYFFTNYIGTHTGGSYRPLMIICWIIGHHLWQLNPFWYHFVQISIHAANAVLLYFLVNNFICPKAEKKRFVLAVLAATIFIILPNHSEGVLWLAAISDTFAAFFFLLSLLLLLFAARSPRRAFWLYAASLAAFAASLLFKEMGMSLPFVVAILAVYYFFFCRENRGLIRTSSAVIPYFAVLALYFYVRYKAIGIFFGYYGENNLHFSWVRTISGFYDLAASFIFSDKWRAVLSLFISDHWAIFTFLFALAAAVLIFIGWKKKHGLFPVVIFSALFVSLLPAAYLGMDLAQNYFSEEGERYAYLPSIFFAWLAAILLFAIWEKIKDFFKFRTLGIVLAIVIVICWGGKLIEKNWRFYEAGRIARLSFNDAVEKIEQGSYAGAVFFGLPDGFHGAPIFRNGFGQAINLAMTAPPVILAPFNHTAYLSGEKFYVARLSENNFSYSSTDKSKLVIAKPEFYSADYQTSLNDYIFERKGINNRYFGQSLDINISSGLADSPRTALFFWNGAGWTIFNTK
jgi:protein O-mannosyl-transferase